jgi:hypothetical protein
VTTVVVIEGMVVVAADVVGGVEDVGEVSAVVVAEVSPTHPASTTASEARRAVRRLAGRRAIPPPCFSRLLSRQGFSRPGLP